MYWIISSLVLISFLFAALTVFEKNSFNKAFIFAIVYGLAVICLLIAVIPSYIMKIGLSGFLPLNHFFIFIHEVIAFAIILWPSFLVALRFAVTFGFVEDLEINEEKL